MRNFYLFLLKCSLFNKFAFGLQGLVITTTTITQHVNRQTVCDWNLR